MKNKTKMRKKSNSKQNLREVFVGGQLIFIKNDKMNIFGGLVENISERVFEIDSRRLIIVIQQDNTIGLLNGLLRPPPRIRFG